MQPMSNGIAKCGSPWSKRFAILVPSKSSRLSIRQSARLPIQMRRSPQRDYWKPGKLHAVLAGSVCTRICPTKTMLIFLETRSASKAGTKVRLLPGKPLRVGRTDKADHSFPDDQQMSSLHFAVEHGEKGCRILDLQSSNGTFLNGARVKEALLANNDEIRAGSTVFVIRILPDEPVSALPPR